MIMPLYVYKGSWQWFDRSDDMIFGIMEHSDTRQAVGKASNGGMIKKAVFYSGTETDSGNYAKKHGFNLFITKIVSFQ